MGKMAIVCPPRGHFSPAKGGAIELDIYDAVVHSRFRGDLFVVGRETDQPWSDVDFRPVPAVGNVDDYRRSVIRLLKNEQLVYLETRQHMATCYGVAKAFPDVPKMLFRHSHTKTPTNPVQHWWRQRQYAPFDRIAIVSEFARARFARDFPKLAERTYVAHNGIDTEAHRPAPEKEKLILFAGRLVPNKGIAEFAQGVSRVLAAHPDWGAEVIGRPSPDYPGFGETIQQAAGDQVRFLGQKPFEETMEAFARASIVVVPSIWEETFGRTAMEANAYGAALVSSGRGGLREVSGGAAVYLDEVTPHTVAEAVEKLIRDADQRLQLAELGRRRSTELFDIRRTVEVIDDQRAAIMT